MTESSEEMGTTMSRSLAVPDMYYVTDTARNSEKCSSGNTVGNEVSLGTKTFTITGQISITEKFDSSQGLVNMGKQVSQSCSKTKSRTYLEN